MIEIREMLRLWLEGRGLQEMARLSGTGRKTLRRYVEMAQSCGVDRDGGVCQLTDELLTAVTADVYRGLSIYLPWGIPTSGLTLQHTNRTVQVEGPEIMIRPVGTRRLAYVVTDECVCIVQGDRVGSSLLVVEGVLLSLAVPLTIRPDDGHTMRSW